MLRVDSENTFFEAETPKKKNAVIEGTLTFMQSIMQVGKPPSSWVGLTAFLYTVFRSLKPSSCRRKSWSNGIGNICAEWLSG